MQRIQRIQDELKIYDEKETPDAINVAAALSNAGRLF
jgi:hypothetical protein